MNNAPHYPEAAQVADDLIGAQLKMVLAEVTRGFDRQERYNDKLDARFETMVTKSEFKAEIGRVDPEKKAKDKEILNQGVIIQAGFDSIEEHGKARSQKSRWFTGIVVAGAGVLSGAVFNFLGLLAK